MMELVFEWDSEKEQENFIDHGVHFETATNAFYDYFRMERYVISARVAEPFERRIYHGNSEIYGWKRVNP